MDALLNAYRDWLSADHPLTIKTAWRALSKQGRRYGMATRDASAFVLELQSRYPDEPRP